MGSKWVHSTCLCSPNGPKVSLEKHIFDPFLTDFWSQNNPFSRHFVTLEGPKWLAMGSKGAHFICFCSPSGLESFLEKHIFDPFFPNCACRAPRRHCRKSILKMDQKCGFSKKLFPYLGCTNKWHEPILSPCGAILAHVKAERAFKMGQWGTTNGSKSRSKPWFSKNDPSPVVVHKMNEYSLFGALFGLLQSTL